MADNKVSSETGGSGNFKLLDKARKLSFLEWVALIWFTLDAFTHLTMEFSYVFFTWFSNGAANSSHPLSFIWREYGKADARWAVYDPTVLSLELLTVFIMGPIAIMMVYGIYYRKPWRHVLNIVICTSELYGGAMTFFPEWLARPVANPNLSDKPIHVWIYLFFMNALWVWVPLILLIDSCILLTRAAAGWKLDQREEAPVGKGWHYFIAFTLVLYVILVPAIVGTAKA